MVSLAQRMIEKAYVEGNISAIKEITDRVEGKARQAVTLTSDLREKFELGVQHVMDETGCTREEAIEDIALLRPEVRALLNGS